MAKVLTVSLPEDVAHALDDLAVREGVAIDDVIAQAIREHIFLRRFRLLRERMTTQAQAKGILTDEDVFERVS